MLAIGRALIVGKVLFVFSANLAACAKIDCTTKLYLPPYEGAADALDCEVCGSRPMSWLANTMGAGASLAPLTSSGELHAHTYTRMSNLHVLYEENIE